MGIIGRKDAQYELEQLCQTPRAEFAVVYGRRRVGKTYLVREYFGNSFAFYATGVAGGNARAQMASFNKSLHEYGGKGGARTWYEAFDQLEQLLDAPDVCREESGGKRVIFIDEMPWLDSPRTDFRMALDLFWNRWGSARHDVLLIACGSATSWIIKHLFKNRGGLHNRVTARIHLAPFTLGECEQYYQANGIVLTHHQMIESYMVFGGVPYYLDLLRPRFGLVQNIDRLCFSEHGALRGEFDELYRSLFKHPERHEAVVRALATKASGLTRTELVKASGLPDGGSLTTTLEELEECGFIRRYRDFAKQKEGGIFQLIDPFSLFYLRFMEGAASSTYWSEHYQTGAVNAWEGYAFELVCLLHTEQLRAALGIAGVAAEASAWRGGAGDAAFQVDLVLDRADGIVDLCEMKFSEQPYTLGKREYDRLVARREAFRSATGTNKALRLVMVCAGGLVRNEYANAIQATIAGDELFV